MLDSPVVLSDTVQHFYVPFPGCLFSPHGRERRSAHLSCFQRLSLYGGWNGLKGDQGACVVYFYTVRFACDCGLRSL